MSPVFAIAAFMLATNASSTLMVEGNSLKLALIGEVSLEEFAGGKVVSVYRKPRGICHGKAVADAARRELRQWMTNCYTNRYSFVFRNCWGFCNHC